MPFFLVRSVEEKLCRTTQRWIIWHPRIFFLSSPNGWRFFPSYLLFPYKKARKNPNTYNLS